jgi:hypothetical protein
MFTSFWARIRARLIDDWRQAWRFWSVRLSAFGAALSAAWVSMPADMRDGFPGAQWIGLMLFISVLLARLVVQDGGKPNG